MSDHEQSLVRTLTVPAMGPAHFIRNFIDQAVCELRFPTLYELEGPKPPAKFALALRKEYPIQELVESVNLGSVQPTRANMHVFKSKKQRWTVTLKAASIVLETKHYDSFSEFNDRLIAILNAAVPVIDSDFFTRVGLRYVNVIPFPRGEIQDWVNSALVGPLGDGVYGDVAEHSGRVIGITPHGGYMLQHGLVIDNSVSGLQKYSLDFDFSQEDVPLSETMSTVQKLHELEFSTFCWALGPAAKAHLGPSTMKEGT